MKESRPVSADRVVFAGGLVAVLCTGFFGAELPSTEGLSSLRTIPYIQTQCTFEVSSNVQCLRAQARP